MTCSLSTSWPSAIGLPFSPWSTERTWLSTAAVMRASAARHRLRGADQLGPLTENGGFGVFGLDRRDRYFFFRGARSTFAPRQRQAAGDPARQDEE